MCPGGRMTHPGSRRAAYLRDLGGRARRSPSHRDADHAAQSDRDHDGPVHTRFIRGNRWCTQAARRQPEATTNCCSRCCIGTKTITQKDRNRPLTWVGVAGFEPTTSSSRTERSSAQSRCSTTFLQLRGVDAAAISAHDRVWPQLTADRRSHFAPSPTRLPA
jgi:hypothetical protein